MSQCTARSKRTGQACGAQAMSGRSVCYHHGGKSLSGFGHPSFKTGRYSRHLPNRARQRYEAGLADPNLIALADEVALLDQRTAELLERHKHGETAARWEMAQESLRAVLSFFEGADYDNAGEALDELGKIIYGGNDYEQWKEIRELAQERRKLAEAERKRLEAAQQTITVTQLLGFMAAVSALIREHVEDTEALRGISNGVRALMMREGFRGG